MNPKQQQIRQVLTSRRRWRGFSMLELLTVLFVIALCISLLLPAIARARAAAYRTQCRNRLAQIGLGLQSYYSTYGVLPPGSVDEVNTLRQGAATYGVSWMVQMLPQLDQGQMASTFDPNVGITSQPAATVVIPTFLCPLSNSSDSTGMMRGIAVSNYAGNYGNGSTGITTDANGVLFLNSSIRYKDIRDGTSNTIFVGERLPTEYDLGWISGTESTLRNTGFGIKNKAGGAGFETSHANGGVFVLGDGSVRFIDQKIEADVFKQLGNRHDGMLTPEF